MTELEQGDGRKVVFGGRRKVEFGDDRELEQGDGRKVVFGGRRKVEFGDDRVRARRWEKGSVWR